MAPAMQYDLYTPKGWEDFMNMSYCKFRNTLSDLEDCLDSIGDELGPEEHNARAALIKVARNILIADDNGAVPEKSIAENEEE